MDDEQQGSSGRGRVLSIDALRGFDMFWIIGGGAVFESLVKIWPNAVTRTIHEQLEHVVWEGFHFEDLIFPTFLFLVGAVMPYSLTRRLEQGQSSRVIHWRVIRRTVLLILFGLILNGLLNFNWATMRWPGVLQRIGVCYFFAALLVIHTRWRTQAIFVAVALLLYWAVTMLIAAPGYAAGDLTMQGCLSSYVDQRLIPGELYYGYGDNEGILSTLPAICTTVLGALAGSAAAGLLAGLAYLGWTAASRGGLGSLRLVDLGPRLLEALMIGVPLLLLSALLGGLVTWFVRRRSAAS